jgi:O-antigen/teichoic acid export membrane protein
MGGFVASAVLQFGLVVAVTHGLATPAAGAFLEAVALFMILSNWGEIGTDTAMVRTVPRLRALGRGVDISTAVRSAAFPVLFVGAIAGLALLPLAPAIADVFFSEAERDEATTYLRSFGVLLPVASATTVLLAATRGFGSMVPYVAVQNLGVPLSRVLLVGAAVITGGGALLIGLAWSLPLLAALIAALLCYRLLARRDAPHWVGEPRPARELAREVWTFAGPRALAAVFGVTITWFDVLLVGALASTREAAIYAAISRLALIGTYALQAMGMAVAPRFSELVTLHQHQPLQHLYRIATSWMMALMWPLYIVMMVFPSLIAQLFGPSYSAGATALVILSAAGLFNLATGNVTVLLLMSGYSKLNMLNAAGALALNVVLNLLLIPRYGMSGAAVAWAASIVANNLAALIQVRRRLGLQPFGNGYWLVALGTVACFGVVAAVGRLAGGESLQVLAGVLLASTALYSAFLWRTRDRIGLASLVGAFGGHARRAT